MKKLLLFIFILFSFLAKSQEYDEIFIRNQINLDDSSVTKIYKDTLVNPVFVRNLINITPTDASGNNTEIQINSSGILGSSPLFTYDPSDSTLVVDSIQLANGEKISWNIDESTINIPTGLGSVVQVGQELQIKVYNNTGSPVPNGKAVYPTGAFNDFPTIGLAQSNTHLTVSVDYGLTTADINSSSFGMVVWFGKANDLNTSMYTIGDTIWISAATPGELTNVKPLFPNYAIQIGIAFKIGTTDGIIFVTSRSSVDDTFTNFYNGTVRENFDFRVTATGGVITGTLSPTNGHPDLTLIFSTGFYIFDTSPSATIILTAGTNSNPQMNYIYIPESTRALTVSTSGFPTTEHKAIAKVLLKSADFVEKYKATINQNINDPLANTTTKQGQLSAITKRIRLDHAKHISGTEGVSTIETVPTPDDVWVSVTEGKVSQLNEHTFPSFDSQIGDSLYISNHFINPDTLIGNLNELLNDANGNTLNNTSFSFVVWGVMNKTGEPSLVKVNLPSGTYAFASPQNAVSDALNYSVYSFPTVYTGVGFLIARFTYTYKNDDWVLIDTEDLTGFTPNSTAGGGAGGTGVTTFLGLSDTESSYTAYEFQVANAGATALESPSGLTYNDSLTLIGDFSADTITADEAIGIGTRHPLKALDVRGNAIISDTVGIGTSDPSQLLHIKSPSFSRLMIETTSTTNYSGIDFKTPSGLFSQFLATSSGFSNQAFKGNGNYLSNSLGEIGLIAYGVNGSIKFNTGGLSDNDERMSINKDGNIFLGNVAKTVENVTEQFIINPQGDLTGTLVSPNLAFTNSDLTTDVGLFLISDNNLAITVNSIEAMRLTEDTVYVDSVGKFGKDLYVRDSTILELIAEHGGGSLTGVMQIERAEILYTNTSQTTIITLPADAVIWNVGINIKTLFDGTGTDLLDIGITTESGRYYNDIDISSVNFDSMLDQQIFSRGTNPDEMTGSTNITFQYTDQNSDATTGQAYVYIHYVIF